MEDEDPFDGHDLVDEAAVDMLMGWDGPTCPTCGLPLGGQDDARAAGADGHEGDARHLPDSPCPTRVGHGGATG